jgi:hypothetical protein
MLSGLFDEIEGWWIRPSGLTQRHRESMCLLRLVLSNENLCAYCACCLVNSTCLMSLLGLMLELASKSLKSSAKGAFARFNSVKSTASGSGGFVGFGTLRCELSV